MLGLWGFGGVGCGVYGFRNLGFREFGLYGVRVLGFRVEGLGI